jgi:hypothetical protein
MGGSAGFFGGLLNGIGQGMQVRAERKQALKNAAMQASLKQLSGLADDPSFSQDPAAREDITSAYLHAIQVYSGQDTRPKAGGVAGALGKRQGAKEDPIAGVQEAIHGILNKVYGEAPPTQARTMESPESPIPGAPPTKTELPSLSGAGTGHGALLTPDQQDQRQAKIEERKAQIEAQREAAKKKADFQANETENQNKIEAVQKQVDARTLTQDDANRLKAEIVSGHALPVTKQANLQRVDIQGPDGKVFKGVWSPDTNELKKVNGDKLGKEYTLYEKPVKETKSESDNDLAMSAYKEAHKIPENQDLTPSQKVEAIKAFKTQTKAADVAASGTGTLNDDELRTLAKMSLVTGQDPPFGLSAKNPLRERYQKIKADLLISQEGGVSDALVKRAEYKGTTREIGDLKVLLGRIGSFEGTAQKNLDQAVMLSKAVGRTGSSLANEYILYTQGKLTDYPALAKFRVAVNTARNEYARVVNSATGGGVTTDEARKEADEIINTSLAQGSFEAAAQQMRIDMGNRKKSINEELQQAMGSAGGKNAPAEDKKSTVDKLLEKYK